ncbi:hypothetical protein GCM10012290_25840 [Halolactibacillus alkaliphilus]|uniref:Uncharacterized protein n=1 Tax=Halolactibacillus alkaliphilus TaxID=442899 RepID=A0A511X521_9BACI|nr:hypothetical protein HAL01_24940 [Halolactibacillus alkaliphilus]GGN76273.1 hypothetical protein GCM10012290_25840 [Halolactibacillus alkaliphilus]
MFIYAIDSYTKKEHSLPKHNLRFGKRLRHTRTIYVEHCQYYLTDVEKSQLKHFETKGYYIDVVLILKATLL